MSLVINWIKSNVFIVIFVVLMLAAMIAGPLVSRSMNASVKADASERASNFSSLDRIPKTSVEIENPGSTPISKQTIINPKLVDAYRKLTEQCSEDGERVHKVALEHNRKGRTIALPELFPSPPEHLKQVLPVEMHRRISAAYANLLQRVDAGQPPSANDVRDVVMRREAQYIPNMFNKTERAELDDSELKVLRDELAKTRLLEYQEKSSNLGVYLDPNSLEIPSLPEKRIPALDEMYNWQWEYWITEDILEAIRMANDGAENVLQAPVKRVVTLEFRENPAAGGGGQSTSGNRRRGGFAGAGMGGAGGGRTGGSGDAAAPGGEVPNPSLEAPLDYNRSFTGRKSNHLYDVRRVRLILDVETIKLPLVMDALARQNFITVLDVRMAPVDRHGAAAGGFVYGSRAVSRVSMDIETIWFREWTSEFMPDLLKQKLGIQVAAGNAQPAG